MLSSTFKKRPQILYSAKRSISRVVDTLIVGGDAPGLATACALSKSDFFIPDESGNKRIILLDNYEIPELQYYKHATKFKVPDQNTVTITFTTLQLLKSLGALDRMNHVLMTPYRKMFVNERFGQSYLSFDDEIIDQCQIAQTQQGFYDEYISKHNYNFYGKSALGASVENNHIKAALHDVIKEHGKWEIIKDDKIRFIRPVTSLDGLSEVELESGRRFKARLIVGNDGKKSSVREMHDIEWSVHSYNQKCIIKTLIHDRPLPGAYQRFSAAGPIAILPLWKNYSFLAWSWPNLLADELMELNHEDFIKEVNDQFYMETKYKFGSFFDRYLPSGVKEISFELPPRALHNRDSAKLKGFPAPLESLSANQHAKDRVAIIGDAATSLHPITGQGYNLGMTASAHLANAIISQLKAGGDIGSYEYWLREFSDKTKKNELQVQAIQEVFKKGYLDTVFGFESLGRLMSLARNAAVDVIETVPILKYQFVFFGAGLTMHPTEYEWNNDISI